MRSAAGLAAALRLIIDVGLAEHEDEACCCSSGAVEDGMKTLNNFDGVRLVAALAVFISHQF